jgi:hypothetical protein
MGRKSTTPKDGKAISAKLSPHLQLGLHQLIGRRWEAKGRKPSQNELLVEAVEDLLEKEGISLSQKEAAVAKWNHSVTERGKIAAFPRKPRRHRNN